VAWQNSNALLLMVDLMFLWVMPSCKCQSILCFDVFLLVIYAWFCLMLSVILQWSPDIFLISLLSWSF